MIECPQNVTRAKLSFGHDIRHDEDARYTPWKVNMWHCFVLFVFGIVTLSLKVNYAPVGGVIGIIISYAVLMIWIYSGFRLALGEKIWNHIEKRRDTSKKNYGIQTLDETALECKLSTKNTGKLMKFQLHPLNCYIRAGIKRFNSCIQSMCNYNKDNNVAEFCTFIKPKTRIIFPFNINLNSRSKRHGKLSSVLVMYLLKGSTKLKVGQDKTRQNVLHGHSEKMLDIANRFHKRLRKAKAFGLPKYNVKLKAEKRGLKKRQLVLSPTVDQDKGPQE